MTPRWRATIPAPTARDKITQQLRELLPLRLKLLHPRGHLLDLRVLGHLGGLGEQVVALFEFAVLQGMKGVELELLDGGDLLVFGLCGSSGDS